MHRVDAPGNDNNRFSAGDPANGVWPTELDADWHNAVQEAICRVIEGAGMSLEKGNDDQLRDAIAARIAAEMTAAQILAKLLTVDGPGSHLNADYLRGLDPDQVVSTARVLTALGYTPAVGSGNIANGNMNQAVQSGIYRFDQPSNRPDGIAWGQVLVMHGAGDTIAQIAFGQSGDCFMRSGSPGDVGGAGQWSAWQRAVTSDLLAGGSLGVNGATMRRNGNHLFGPDNLTNLNQLANGPGYITAEGRAYPRRVGGGELNFNWSGQSGQPSWLWGGNDGFNMYVYDPANFSVAYAASAGNADTIDGYHAAAFAQLADFSGSNDQNGYCRLPGGRVLQWGSIHLNEDSYATVTFPLAMAYCGYAAVEGMAEIGNAGAANNNPRIYGWSGVSANIYNPQAALNARWFAIGYV